MSTARRNIGVYLPRHTGYYSKLINPDQKLRPGKQIMPIRLIAKELYKAQQELEKLEAEFTVAPYGEKEAIKEKLRKKRAEWQDLRNILDGEKEPSPFSQTPSTISGKKQTGIK